MTTMTFTLTNNLMAGLTLRAIEEKIPCFSNVSNASFDNVDETIEVTISCREEDANFIKEHLTPFF